MSLERPPVKVILVDDTPSVRSRLQTNIGCLEEVDIVGSAGNVADGRALIEHVRPDAIILDLRLPDGSGIEILQHVKREAGGPVVIILTAHPSPPTREKCLALGADYFFDKSLEFEQVAHVLTRLTGSRLPIRENGTKDRPPAATTPGHQQATAEDAGCWRPPKAEGGRRSELGKEKRYSK